ncbi:superoxide dismutase [Ni] [Saccharicrinis sp. FJH62]|uniref:superoxide dismutase [Ni] n=1 Tax=Saccharicrinis sp. FJH62 TaxID=3344657 RepID=UPI0035D4DAA8
MMKLKLFLTSLIILAGLSLTQKTYAHCEIPCGIYGDSLRFKEVYEHITTIEKSMREIDRLSKEDVINYNQIVRWVNNKDDHANKVQDIVEQYFLHQRIKIKDPSESEAYHKYTNQLVLLHKMLVYAMKAKQTTDLAYIKQLNDTWHTFEHAYFDE